VPGSALRATPVFQFGQVLSFCEKSRVSSFQVAAKSIFDIAAPALVGRVHTLHYIWQGRFVCSQIKAGCLYHFGGQAESAVSLKNPFQKGGEMGGRVFVVFGNIVNIDKISDHPSYL
jgi:hypothetical protein